MRSQRLHKENDLNLATYRYTITNQGCGPYLRVALIGQTRSCRKLEQSLRKDSVSRLESHLTLIVGANGGAAVGAGGACLAWIHGDDLVHVQEHQLWRTTGLVLSVMTIPLTKKNIVKKRDINKYWNRNLTPTSMDETCSVICLKLII